MANDEFYFPDFPQSPCPPCNCAMTYTVEPGDTLYSIAQAYGIPVATLMHCNSIANPYNLKPGTRLCIPGSGNWPMPPNPNPMPPCPSPNPNPMPPEGMPPSGMECSGTLHTIAEGDTLYMIAKQYRIPLAVIMRANPNMDPYNLQIGQQLCIPAAGSGQTPSCPGGMLYQTQRGDTLTRIAERFNVTYEALMMSNPNVDFTGSLETLTLCIPGRMGTSSVSAPEEPYRVMEGDTLETVSLKMLVVSDSLLMANPTLTVSDFSVPGTEINMPS